MHTGFGGTAASGVQNLGNDKADLEQMEMHPPIQIRVRSAIVRVSADFFFHIKLVRPGVVEIIVNPLYEGLSHVRKHLLQ
jgi:hypothetical protein